MGRTQIAEVIEGVYKPCRPGHEEVVALLLEQPGLDVNATDNYEYFALHIALNQNHVGHPQNFNLQTFA